MRPISPKRSTTKNRNELPKETPMRRTTNETLISAVRGGVIAGMVTSVLLSKPNGQFSYGRDA